MMPGTTYILNIVMNDGTNMRGVSGNVSAETNQPAACAVA